jgi:hypothetical protein
MANTSVLRNAGVTTAISVTASSTSAVVIDDNTNDQVNYCSFLNTGATNVAVNVGNSSVGAAVLPVSGSTTGNFVLPASMTTPLVLAVPTTPFYVRMIGSGAGPSIVYVTPAADQS